LSQDNHRSASGYWWEALITYFFPMVLFALAIIPALNHVYSGHGGLAWFIAPLCFPWVIARALFKVTLGSRSARRWYWRFYKVTLPSYIALALPLSWAATASIETAYGLQVSPWLFFGMMISPFPWLYFS
jgi:hypothetical protein